jgi:hypothetical protein
MTDLPYNIPEEETWWGAVAHFTKSGHEPQDVADPTAKDVAIHGPVNYPGGVEPIKAHSGEHCIVGSVIGGHMIHDPLPWRGPAIAAEHRQRCPRFLHELQAVDIEGLARLPERGTERLDALRAAF